MNKWAFTLIFDIDFSRYAEEKILTDFIINYLSDLLGDFGTITEQFLEPNRLTIDIIIIADTPDEAEEYLNTHLQPYREPPNNMTIIRINDYE